MKSQLCLIVAMLLVGSVAVAGDHQKHGRGHDVNRATGSVEGSQIGFSAREVQVIREYYGPRYENLPPGLRKKIARGGSLPPGWQKKVEPFPVTLERRLAVLPPDYRRGVIDGHAVIYRRGSSIAFDVAVLF